jgi:N-acetylglucosamine-6-phosphate deacetylase
VLEERAGLLADAVEAGIIAGIHYEGPFLSEARCGAQNPAFLVPATPTDATKLVEAGRGYAVSITLAPERCLDEDGREAVRLLVEGGILPSWGHSDCTVSQANEAVEMGVDLLAENKIRGGKATVTHLFNGMPPMHHRSPGPIPALLSSAQDGEIIAEMICDGVHLDPLLVNEVAQIVGRDNAVFVTDSMAAAGMADGDYVLGPNAVTVADGVARLTEGGNLAGGTSHIMDQVRIAVVDGGIPLEDAVYMASKQGAKVLGLEDRGEIKVGLRADILVASDDLHPVRVFRNGASVVAQ